MWVFSSISQERSANLAIASSGNVLEIIECSCICTGSRFSYNCCRMVSSIDPSANAHICRRSWVGFFPSSLTSLNSLLTCFCLESKSRAITAFLRVSYLSASGSCRTKSDNCSIVSASRALMTVKYLIRSSLMLQVINSASAMTNQKSGRVLENARSVGRATLYRWSVCNILP